MARLIAETGLGKMGGFRVCQIGEWSGRVALEASPHAAGQLWVAAGTPGYRVVAGELAGQHHG